MSGKTKWKLCVKIYFTMDHGGSSCLNAKVLKVDDVDFFTNFYNHLIYDIDPGIESITRDCMVNKKDYKGIYEWNGMQHLVLQRYKNRRLDNILLYISKKVEMKAECAQNAAV